MAEKIWALTPKNHTRVTVRNAPTGGSPFFQRGPWLYKALTQYQVPEPAQQPVADALFNRLGALLRSFADPAQRIFVFDSQDPAIGASNDFENEIHLTPAGYRKVGAAFAAFIESKL